MKASDLTGDARAAYDTWVSLGMSEPRALEEASVLQTDEQMAELLSARSRIPIEEARTRVKLGKRNQERPLVADPFDALVEAYRASGLSEDAARLAAIGRGRTESEVRAELFEAARARFSEAERESLPSGHEQLLAHATNLHARYHGLTESRARPGMIAAVRRAEGSSGWTGQQYHEAVAQYAKGLEALIESGERKASLAELARPSSIPGTVPLNGG